MNHQFSLQSRKKSQTLPASAKPSAIDKKRGNFLGLSPKLRLKKDKRSASSFLNTSSSVNQSQVSRLSNLHTTSSPLPGSSIPSLSNQMMPSPISGSASPIITATKTKEVASVMDCADDNTNENSEIVVPSNGNDGGEGTSHVGIKCTDELEQSCQSTVDGNRTKAAIGTVHQKINRTKDMIKTEQTSRDENVNEYLKLAASCSDKPQTQRIKSVFEKKNQKSAQTIAQLQRKLESYGKKIRDLEANGMAGQHHRQPKAVLRDVSQGFSGVVGNIKGGLSGLTAATHTAAETVMSKPREFAHLIKNKFGSADNISSMSKPADDGEYVENNHHGSATFTHSTKYTSDDECSSITSGSAGQVAVATTNSTSPGHQPMSTNPIHDAPNSPSFPISSLPTVNNSERPEPNNEMLVSIWAELHDRRDESQRIQEDIDSLKAQMQHDYSIFNQTLQDERYRYERLEEQMNDLIELHQNEIENLKTGISDMEEKVQYQSEERLNDLHELMESCQTRISRMEHQQHQHQQLVSIEGIENSNARALVLKLINIVLTVLQVVLLLVATTANIIMPFLKTRVRTMTTVVLIVVAVLIFQQRTELIDKGYRLFTS